MDNVTTIYSRHSECYRIRLSKDTVAWLAELGDALNGLEIRRQIETAVMILAHHRAKGGSVARKPWGELATAARAWAEAEGKSFTARR